MSKISVLMAFESFEVLFKVYMLNKCKIPAEQFYAYAHVFFENFQGVHLLEHVRL